MTREQRLLEAMERITYVGMHQGLAMAHKISNEAIAAYHAAPDEGPGDGVRLSTESFDRFWDFCRDYAVDYEDMRRLMKKEIFSSWQPSAARAHTPKEVK